MQREMTREISCSGSERTVLSRAVYCRADESKTDNKSSWKTANTVILHQGSAGKLYMVKYSEVQRAFR